MKEWSTERLRAVQCVAADDHNEDFLDALRVVEAVLDSKKVWAGLFNLYPDYGQSVLASNPEARAIYQCGRGLLQDILDGITTQDRTLNTEMRFLRMEQDNEIKSLKP